jgi:hypothetical protein
LSIYDVTGRLIKEHTLDNSPGSSIINIRDLASGVYFVRVDRKGESKAKKIVKVK